MSPVPFQHKTRHELLQQDLDNMSCSATVQQAPVGFWDPLGLSSDGDAAVFARRREVELKCFV